MIDELIVHVGPAKTSTTAVQVAFSKSKDYLATQGFFYEPDRNSIANYRMHRFLKETTVEALANLTVEQLRHQPDFPNLSSFGRQMISCEGFAGLESQESIDCIVRWADPRKIRLVIVFREPTKWLWSLFQQMNRNQLQPGDWTKFVEDSLAKSVFFLSQTLKPWSHLQPFPQIVIVDQTINPVSSTPILIAEALGAELNPGVIRDTGKNMYNESLGLGESMLMPMFNQEVVNELRSRQRNHWGDIPDAFVRNILLYNSDTSKVMFELGRDLESNTYSKQSKILDESCHAGLQKFADAWWDDFDQTVNNLASNESVSHQQTDLPEVNRVRPPIFSGFDLPIGKGFPQSGFENLIELPPEFFSLARLCASNIGLLFKAMHHPERVSWLNEKE